MSSEKFNNMLNEHLKYDLMKEKMEAASYLYKWTDKDEEWIGGEVPIPFMEKTGSVRSGRLVHADRVASNRYLRGKLTPSEQAEIFMAAEFLEKDIFTHKGELKERTFIGDLLPRQMDCIQEEFITTLNHQILNSTRLDTAVGVGSAAGVVEVNRVERFILDQYVKVGTALGFVNAIDVNENQITITDAVNGGSPVDLSGEAANADIFQEDFDTAVPLNGLSDMLLSEANGGSANLHGISKVSSPFLQALNFDGSGIVATDILQQNFNFYSEYKRKRKVGATDMWMSYKNLTAIMDRLEQDKGKDKFVRGSEREDAYGFTEIMLTGPKGRLKVVGIPEMDDDKILYMAEGSTKLHSNGGIQKIIDPDGKAYERVRDSEGTGSYRYICDMVWRGQFVLHSPYKCAIVHGISF